MHIHALSQSASFSRTEQAKAAKSPTFSLAPSSASPASTATAGTTASSSAASSSPFSSMASSLQSILLGASQAASSATSLPGQAADAYGQAGSLLG